MNTDAYLETLERDIDFSRELVSFESLTKLTQSMALAASTDKIYTLASLSIMGKLALSRVRFYINVDKGEWKSLPSKKVFSVSSKDRNPEFGQFLKMSESLDEDSKPQREASNYIFPVPFSKGLAAFLFIDSRTGSQNGEYRELNTEELRYIELVISLVISAITNYHTNLALQAETYTAEKHNLLLTNLFHINKDFATLFSEKEILKVFSYYLMGHLQVTRFAVVRESDPVEIMLNRFPSIEDNKLLYLHTQLSEKKILEEEQEVKLYMKAEIRGEAQGALFLGSKMSGASFSDYDLQYLRSLINTTFTALENARLFDEQLKLQVIEGELELARNIQNGFLPREIPPINGYEAYGKNLSAKHVGGDYYDVIKDKEGNYAIVMADVSGKGVPASLIMANLQAAVRLLVGMGFKLEIIVEELNTLICANTAADKFVTLCLSLLKTDKFLLKNCTAGHPPPIQLRRNERNKYQSSLAHFLTKGGMVLGVVEGYKDYESEYTNVGSGDVFVYYTDGFTDGDLGDKSGQDVFLDTVVDSLNNNLDSNGKLNLEESVDQIIERMSRVEGILPDDMTLFLLHKT